MCNTLKITDDCTGGDLSSTTVGGVELDDVESFIASIWSHQRQEDFIYDMSSIVRVLEEEMRNLDSARERGGDRSRFAADNTATGVCHSAGEPVVTSTSSSMTMNNTMRTAADGSRCCFSAQLNRNLAASSSQSQTSYAYPSRSGYFPESFPAPVPSPPRYCGSAQNILSGCPISSQVGGQVIRNLLSSPKQQNHAVTASEISSGLDPGGDRTILLSTNGRLAGSREGLSAATAGPAGAANKATTPLNDKFITQSSPPLLSYLQATNSSFVVDSANAPTLMIPQLHAVGHSITAAEGALLSPDADEGSGFFCCRSAASPSATLSTMAEDREGGEGLTPCASQGVGPGGCSRVPSLGSLSDANMDLSCVPCVSSPLCASSGADYGSIVMGGVAGTPIKTCSGTMADLGGAIEPESVCGILASLADQCSPQQALVRGLMEYNDAVVDGGNLVNRANLREICGANSTGVGSFNVVSNSLGSGLLSLCMDQSGNHIIQRLLELTWSCMEVYEYVLKGNFVQLSYDTYGCRVVQKALDCLAVQYRIGMCHIELKDHIMSLIQDQNGNHVIQKCVDRIPPNECYPIVNACRDHALRLSLHAYGCRVMQRVLEHCQNNEHTYALLDQLQTAIPSLIKDQFGNYVVQHILKYGRYSDVKCIVDIVVSNLLTYSCHKFASNVAERCLERYISVDLRAAVVSAAFDPCARGIGKPPILCMIRDPYANYVVQRILSSELIDLDNPQRQDVLTKLEKHLPALRKFTYGRHIVESIERLKRRVDATRQ